MYVAFALLDFGVIREIHGMSVIAYGSFTCLLIGFFFVFLVLIM